MTAPAILIRGGLVNLPGGEFKNCDVEIRGNVIARVGDIEPAGDMDVFDASNHIVAPGLINAHTHSNENWHRGKFDNLPLEPWMLFAYPVLHGPAQSPRELYLRTVMGAMEMARTGTTAVVDFLYEFTGITEESLGAVVEAYRDVGVRALICLAAADRTYYESVVADMSLVPRESLDELDRNSPPSADEWDAELRNLVERFHDPENGIMIGLGPSGPQRCSDNLLMRTREIADDLDLQIHTHTLETKMQRASGADMYGTTIVRHLRDIGFLSPRTHLTHGVWIDGPEMDLLAESGATVVHNPISNLKLGSGIAPIPEMTGKRVGVSLGTDGMCAGDGQNMYEAVKLAALVHKVNGEPFEDWFGAADAWDLATRQGARALGAEVGAIEPGNRADLCLLSMKHGAFTPLNDPMLHLALQIPTGAIDHVMVNGDWKLRDGNLTGVDEAELLAEAREIGPGLVDRHQKAFAFGDALLPSVSAGWHTVNSTPNKEFDADG